MPRFGTHLASLVVTVLATTLDAAPLGTAFTYQGTLARNGTEVTDSCDFSFGLWDALAGGVEVAVAVDVLNVQVTEGTFTVELDYGAGVFDGDARWLEIAVACPGGGGLTTLAPRQKLTPSPHALFAAEAGAIEWTGLIDVPPDIADGDDVDDADADPGNEIQTLAEVLSQGNSAGGTTITNLPIPVADSDASTKGYVDAQAGGSQTLAEVLTQGNDAGGASIENIGTATVSDLIVSGLDCSANANGGALTANASGVVSCSDDDIGGGSGGNTLDQAYDQGGAGAGRTITADSGAVMIDGPGGLRLDSGSLLQLAGDPVLVGSLPIGQNPTSVFVAGRYVYVVDGGSTDLKVIDASDPSAPSLVGSLSIGSFPTSVYVSGRYAYVVDEVIGDLKVIDVSDPSAPTLAGSLVLGVGAVPYSVHVSGPYAYVVDIDSDELKLIDVSDPTTPSLAGSLGLGTFPSSLFVSGRYAYVLDQGADDLKVIDVADPQAPVLAGSLGIGTDPSDLYVSGRYAYVVDSSSNDLKVIDVSDPGTPSLAGSLGVGVGPTSIHVSGHYAYVTQSGADDLKVIDVSDPGTPTLAGSLGIGSFPIALSVAGRYAYVVDLGSDDLKVIDVSGGEVTSLMAHSLEAGNLQVRGDVIAQGQAQVAGGLNVGPGGIFSDGDVGVRGDMTLSGNTPLTLSTLDCTSNANGGALTVDSEGVVQCSDDDGSGQDLAEVLAQGNDAGGITISNLPTPIADSDASTKAYVDAQAGADQTLAEVLLEGNDAGGVSITNLAAPIAASDASTKAYTDAHTDDDADATNELQDLSLGGNTLSLTDDLTPVDLSAYLDNTDDQNLAEVLVQGNNAGGASMLNIGTTATNALTISGLNCTGNANGGALTADASGVVSCSDDEGGAGGGSTLDQAYDQGGAGAGRAITADAGAVDILGIGSPALNVVSDFNPALRVTASSDSGEDTGLEIVGARNALTTSDAAFIDLKDFDSNEGAGTEFTMARIGGGMADVSGQTGFLRFYTNAGDDLQERMRIDKQGSVSIGSESGTERLKVAGDVTIGGGTAIGLHDGNSEYLRIRGRVDDWYLGVRDAPTGPEHDFFIGLNDQDFTRFNFDRSGNLGLGTEPAADLHLASTGSQQIRIEADTDNSGESDQPSIVMSQDGGINVTTIGYIESRNHFSIRTSDSGSGATHILLEPEGRVGLGTASPQNTLDVSGPGTSVGGVGGIDDVVTRFRQTTANTPTAIAIDALSAENAILYFSDNGDARWSLRSTEDLDLSPTNVLNLRYHDPAGGSATNLLTFVSNAVLPRGDNVVSLGAGGALLPTPFEQRGFKNVVSYAFTNPSDRRLKRDIKPLDYGIDEVMRLQPVRFRWKTGKDHREVLGVIAQDVHDVVPETVTGNPDREEDRLGVRYSELIPVLIRGMQDQQVQLEVLIAENAELRERLSALESLVLD